MKRGVRWIAFIAVCLLCLGMSAAVSGAGLGKLVLRSEEKHPERGKNFTVVLQCSRNPGIRSMRLSLSYDKQALEVKKITDLKLFPGGKVEDTKGAEAISFRADEAFDAVGDIAKITFRVKKNAPYGAARISVSWSERTPDIQSAGGAAVPFEVQEWSYELVCPHKNVNREVVTPASLSKEGVARVTCDDCGESWTEVLKPEIVSEDGAVRAVLPAGIFAEGIDPRVAVEYVYSGEEYDEARNVFGDRLIRAFRIHFTTPGGTVLPRGDINIDLKCEAELPEYVSLYAFEDGYTDRLDMEAEGNTVRFYWRDSLLLLVSTPPEEETETSEGEPVSEDDAPAVTLSPEEEQRRRDGIALASGAGALAVTGVGIYFLLRQRRKKY